MRFGKVEDKAELDHINFRLPNTLISQREIQYLNYEKNNFDLYVGAPAWGASNWVGKIYPKGTKQKDYLHQYAQIFNAIELNTTYYRAPSEKQIEQWIAQTHPRFRFCPKFPKNISHMGQLNNRSAVLDFCSRIEAFRDRLGITFLQLNEQFSPRNALLLIEFIALLPKNMRFAIEFRHPEWFTHSHDVFTLMEKQKISLVITDVAGRRDVLKMRLTTNFVMIRFVGNELHESDYRRIDQWVMKIKAWHDLGMKEVYFFIHQPDEITVPEITNYFIQKAHEAKLTPMKGLKFYNDIEEREDDKGLF